jgi:hypothetical protein
MESIGLLVKLEARPGKEADAEAFLRSAQPLALDERATLKWYAIKLGPGKFGIFDTFANEAGRNAHLTGEIAKALTNGSVSRPAASHSRMTNGTVQKGSGTTLVVHYQDGSKTISVPPNVPVVEVAPEKVAFAGGDTVYVATEKLPDGTLTTNRIFVIAPAVSPNTKQ